MGTECTPLRDETDAWRVAIFPDQFDRGAQTRLLDRGYQNFEGDDGRMKREPFLGAIEEFTLAAIDPTEERNCRSDPIFTDPGTICVAATLGTVAVMNHEKYAELTGGYYDPEMALTDNIIELWEDHIHWLIHNHDHGNLILQDMAEEAYSRDRTDARGPPPGRVCTGVKSVPELGGDPYVEINIEHLNRTCMVRDDDGDIITRITNGSAYVPLRDLDEKVTEQMGHSFDTHIGIMMDRLTNRKTSWLVSETQGIHKVINSLFERGAWDELFTERRYEPKLKVIMDAVRTYDYDDISFGEWLTANELFDAIRDYEPHPGYRRIHSNITSPLSVSKILGEFEDHGDVAIDREGEVNKFLLRNINKDYIDIDIENPTDVLELPCLQAVDERLMEGDFTREILFSLARILLSLESDFTLETIAEEFYSRYPWYDKEITMYQLRYEKNRRIHGRRPKPIGCNSEVIQPFCIGKENCNHSIYSSLPFKEQVYDDLGSA